MVELRLWARCPQAQTTQLETKTLARQAESGGRAGSVAAMALESLAYVFALELPSGLLQERDRARIS